MSVVEGVGGTWGRGAAGEWGRGGDMVSCWSWWWVGTRVRAWGGGKNNLDLLIC